MNCQETKSLINAYADDELDVGASLQVGTHLQKCGGCVKALDAIRAARTAVANPALYLACPKALRDFVEKTAGAGEKKTPAIQARSNFRLWQGLGIAAAIALVFVTSWGLLGRASQNDLLADAVLTSHLRSFQADHLMDVKSTDQHTVKPWFDGRLDFAPPVKDLVEDGFPLAGGRLDYLDGRPVAALIYRHRLHVINVFVWPGESGESTVSRKGYNLVHWSSAGMSFWAVSDVNLADLQQMADLLRVQNAPPSTSR